MTDEGTGGHVKTTIVEFSFYPDPDQPQYGLLHVLTDSFGGAFERRATMRGDVDRVRMIKTGYHDGGPVSKDDAPDVALTGGAWQMAPGWPDDWDYDAVADDQAWSQSFTITPDGVEVLDDPTR